MSVAIQDRPKLGASDVQTFGSYGSSASLSSPATFNKMSYNSLTGQASSYGVSASPVQDKMSYSSQENKPLPYSTQLPPGKSKNSVSSSDVSDIENKSVPWFREIGITSDPIEMKRIWSPRFERHYASRKWGETYQGRIAMRAASRAVIGAAVFSAVEMFAAHSLKGYVYDKTQRPKGVIPHLAWGIDKTFGTVIQTAVTKITGNPDKGLSAVLFRETNTGFGYTNPRTGKAVGGRSLGYEIVDLTLGFASMSFTDYMTRYAISIFDPHSKTKWIKVDKEGHKHINPLGGAKETGKAIFNAFTYAAGEDIFVCVPYAFFTEAQSRLINKISPGFKLDFDRRKVGTSIKINAKGEAIGNYNLEGIIDFTGRFTAYNVGTKIFRDIYSRTEEKIHDLKEGKTQEDQLARKEGNIATRTIKYLFVTTTKTVFSTLPAAFLFGFLRVPSSKRGRVAINPETGAVITKTSPDAVKNTLNFDIDGADVFNTGHTIYSAPNKMPGYNNVLNPIGRFFTRLGDRYESIFRALGAEKLLKNSSANKRKDVLKEFANRYASAGIPYFVYFGYKSDIVAPFLDTNRSNFVLGGFFSSAWNLTKALASFDGKKIKAAFAVNTEWRDESWRAMIKQPSSRYERQIQRQMNDEGYKLSNEGLSLYQDTYEKRYQRQEERQREREKIEKYDKDTPTYKQLNNGQSPAAPDQNGSSSLPGNPAGDKFSSIIENAGFSSAQAGRIEKTEQAFKEHDPSGTREPATYSQRYKSVPFSPASVIIERQQKEPVTTTSLHDRALVMPGSNAIN